MSDTTLNDWAIRLDRDITVLRSRSESDIAREEVLSLLDNSFAELQAANDQVNLQSRQLEVVVSEAQLVRRRTEVLLGLMTDGVMETDAAGVIQWANDSLGRMFNVRTSFLRMKPLVLFVGEDDRKLLNQCLASLGETGSTDKVEISLVPRNRPPIQATVSARRLVSGDDRAESFIWLLRGADESGAERQEHADLDRDTDQRTAVLRDLDESIADRLAGIRKLAHRVVDLQDIEGQKLARELRERFGQTLGAIKLNLSSLVRARTDLSHAPLMQETVKLVDAALQRLREIYFELSPPLTQGVGLVGVIRQMLARWSESNGLTATLEADPLPLLSPQVESAAVWVVREALANVARHSGATAVEIMVQREGNRLNLCIRDNGRGFSLPDSRHLAERAGSFGLVGMEERVSVLGGDFEIRSAPGEGTEIRAVFTAALR